MEDQMILQNLGLDKHESKLYLILLRTGEATAVTLAREASLHRRTVYDTLEKLQKKGLVGLKIKKFVKYFSAANPIVLNSKFEENQAMFLGLLPKLLNQYSSNEKKLNIHIYEGVEGLKTIITDACRECIDRKNDYVALGAGLNLPKKLGYAMPHFLETMKNIKLKMIQPDKPEIREELKSWPKTFQTRYLPKKYISPMSISAYSDRTVILLFEGEPVIIQIIGKKTADSFKNYFELLWKIAKN